MNANAGNVNALVSKSKRDSVSRLIPQIEVNNSRCLVVYAVRYCTPHKSINFYLLTKFKTMKTTMIFLWVNLQGFLIYSKESAEHGVCNSVMAIGHKGNKNIVIDPVYIDEHDAILDLIEAELDIHSTREWVVKAGDGFTVDTWDNMLIKKYDLVEK